jgi:2-polyprenyl-3-methyl-5-hydroxy-6-metoxy-1,4-benzoquinol methylase
MPVRNAPALSEQIAEGYYETTAQRGHQNSSRHYQVAAQHLKRKLHEWLPRDRNARCLDLACGCGEFLHLLENEGLTNTAGVDLCKEELDEARKHVRGDLHLSDVLEYLQACEAGSIDFVSALNLLEHLSKDKLLAVLTECHRVLAPGGALVAMVPNAVSPFGSLTRHWDITHEWAFTTNNFRQLAALVGFESHVEFRECGPRVHGLLSGIRFVFWQGIRAAIAAWLLVELGTTKDGIYSMDMLVRLRVTEK